MSKAIVITCLVLSIAGLGYIYWLGHRTFDDGRNKIHYQNWLPDGKAIFNKQHGTMHVTFDAGQVTGHTVLYRPDGTRMATIRYDEPSGKSQWMMKPGNFPRFGTSETVMEAPLAMTYLPPALGTADHYNKQGNIQTHIEYEASGSKTTSQFKKGKLYAIYERHPDLLYYDIRFDEKSGHIHNIAESRMLAGAGHKNTRTLFFNFETGEPYAMRIYTHPEIKDNYDSKDVRLEDYKGDLMPFEERIKKYRK